MLDLGPDGKSTQADFVRALFGLIIDPEDEAASAAIYDYSDRRMRDFFSGHRIARLANSVKGHLEPEVFRSYLQGLPDATVESLCRLFEDVLPDINPYNVGELVANLFVSIITVATGGAQANASGRQLGATGNATMGNEDRRLDARAVPELVKVSKASAARFANKLDDVLFAEGSFERALTLADLYVPSPLNIYDNSHDPMVSLCEKVEKALLPLQNNEAGRDNKHRMQWATTVITGVGGVGKTSFVASLAKRYLNGELLQNSIALFVSGQDIRNSRGFPKEDLERALEAKDFDLYQNVIIVLDAYDEISFVSDSRDANEKYAELLDEARGKCGLIIFSRPNYLPIHLFNNIELLPFSQNERKQFLESYNSKRAPHERVPQAIVDACVPHQRDPRVQFDSDLKDIVSIPMLLYMIAVLKIRVDTIKDKYALYDRMFSKNQEGFINQRGSIEEKRISKKIWDDSYQLAQLIAVELCKNGSGTITESQILQIVRDMEVTNAHREILSNRFAIEIFLKGGKDRSFSFVHRSIYDFFAGKQIARRLNEMVVENLTGKLSVEDLVSGFNEIFCYQGFNDTVFQYLTSEIANSPDFDTLESRKNEIIELYNEVVMARFPGSGKEALITEYRHFILWANNYFNILFGLFGAAIDYVRVDLSAINFLLRTASGVEPLYLHHIDMSKADLTRVRFIRCSLYRCNFTGAHLQDADFRYAALRDQIFKKCDLSGASFAGNLLRGIAFHNCKLLATDFTNATLIEVSLENSTANFANFSGAHVDSSTAKSMRSVIRSNPNGTAITTLYSPDNVYFISDQPDFPSPYGKERK